jgi:photosystem II stability/assembly factor-like uncharacterized protein
LTNFLKTKATQNQKRGREMIKFVVFTLILFCGICVRAQTQGKFTQTRATSVADVAVSAEGTIWIVKKDGTISFSTNGRNWTTTEGDGFSRISANTDSSVYGVGSNGTLWKYDGENFTQTKAEGMVDVAVTQNGRIWTVGKNETVWYSDNDGARWRKNDANGFRNIAVADNGTLWATGTNGTLWNLRGRNWKQTNAEGIGDVSIGAYGQIYLVGKNGTFWISTDRGANFNQINAKHNFLRVGAGSRGGVYLVDAEGNLWKYQ